jgi:hypothetical protein
LPDNVLALLNAENIDVDDFDLELDRHEPVCPVLERERTLMIAASFAERWHEAGRLAALVCAAWCNRFPPTKRRGRRC